MIRFLTDVKIEITDDNSRLELGFKCIERLQRFGDVVLSKNNLRDLQKS